MLLCCPRLPAAATLASVAATAWAARGPIPRLMHGTPLEKDAWRMERLEIPRRDAESNHAQSVERMATALAQMQAMCRLHA